MSSEGDNKPTFALLGATGGCVLAFLVRALQAGHKCSACECYSATKAFLLRGHALYIYIYIFSCPTLTTTKLVVRTPSKLTDLLKTQGVSADLISKHLTIVQGNSKDSIKVAEALKVNNIVADMVVSGVGGVPVFKPNPLRPTLDDPTICQDTVSIILNALRELHTNSTTQAKKKPTLVAISSTGISDHNRDVPLAMLPLYHWMLPIPHKDKKMMEKLLVEEIKNGASSAIENFVAVRPSLLTNGRAEGFGAIRAGVDSPGKFDNSAIGYTISRADVGGWIYEGLVEDKAGKKSNYLNQCVAITS